MTVGTIADDQARQVAQEITQRHGAKRYELIPILTDVNHQLGYLPPEALDEISIQLKVPKSQIYSAASFYSMLSTKPRGRHVIQFCESAPCHVQGGREVWSTLQALLKLNAGETSPDKRWTLMTTSCLGLCADGPVLLVDDDLFMNVTPDQIAGILAKFK
jgi:NADH:ubiquinone oxidoreductase subunit E